MSRQHSVFGVLEKPSRPRPTHEQLDEEISAWLAKGGQVKELHPSQYADSWGDWKARNNLKRQRNREGNHER